MTHSSHTLPVRIYYEDTDAGGLVYHARYLHYAERARAEMLRTVGVESSAMMRDHHAGFAVKSAEMSFIRPAHLDDALQVISRVKILKGASLEIEHSVMRGDEALVQMNITLVCLGQGEKPVRIPDGVRTALESYC